MSVPVVEIVTVGREILDGRVIDTNAVFIAETLGERGLVPRFGQRVDDDFARLNDAFTIAARRADIVLVTGGLGPTSDDLTLEAFARFLGVPCQEDARALEVVNARLGKLQREMTAAQRKQAQLPRGAQALANPEGTAPGAHFAQVTPDGRKQLWFFMPGVPVEMKRMLREQIAPLLPSVPAYRSYAWITQFTSEGDLQMRLGEVIAALPPQIELGFRTRFPENHIGLHGVCNDAALTQIFERSIARISEILGDDVFARGEAKSLEEVTLALLAQSDARLVTVESCTGGLVAHRLTEIPGSSQNFWGAWVVYDNRAKIQLGVPAELLQAHGAVSAAVAESLARRGLERLREQGAQGPLYALATTGIAGPGGGNAEKPVGLCYVALAGPGGVQVQEVRARPGLTRSQHKLLFAQKALDLLRRALLAPPRAELDTPALAAT